MNSTAIEIPSDGRQIPGRLCRSRLLLLLILSAALLAACASRPYQGSEVNAAAFLARSISQKSGSLKVTAAVPDADETRALTGLDLYEQGIQPVWLKVENTGTMPVRVAIWSIDRDYYSPIEVAYMNRDTFSSQGYADLERWFYDNALPREIPSGETRSGLVFTQLHPGTKGFNLDIIDDETAYSFTFFVPMPGFVADFMDVNFAELYTEEEIRDLDADQLRVVLERELLCCAADSSDKLVGMPFNLVLIGSGPVVRRSMLRGSWLESAAGGEAGRFVVEQARKQHYRGRQPDAIFTLPREDGNETIHIHLWLAPWRVDSEPVWVGQTFYWTDDKSSLGWQNQGPIKDANSLSFFARESVTADLDSAQRFIFQDFWYNGSLRKAGFISGVGVVTMDNPRADFSGTAYFTEGLRVVVFLSEDPVALDDGELIYLEEKELQSPENSQR